MSKVLFSIRPIYADKILSGEKRFEFRTVRCQRFVDRMIIYASAPVFRIVGEIAIRRIIQAPPNIMWVETQYGAGISKADFDAYFLDRTIAVAYQLEVPARYSSPVSLSSVGIERPPQSFQYLSEEQYKSICCVRGS